MKKNVKSMLNPFKILVLHFLISSCIGLKAQDLVIYGQVLSSEDNEPLIGVNVYIENSSIGTITDIDGNFQLEVLSKESVLVFSFIGYKEKMIPVGDQKIISVNLEPEYGVIDELVVIGYQSTRKVNISGAVDQIGTEELQSRPIHNLAQGLQGVSPNLNIDFNGGEPGRAAKINIRGITSINEGSPLILIDNIPSDPEDINRISPEDVESISVLKDASSAAIYGARAAYGVILITTKRGMQEGLNFNYTNNFSWDKPTVLPEKFTDPYIYL